MPIYEGTSQIQSLMAMKDTLGGIIKNPQGFLKRIAQARWRAIAATKDPVERRLAKLQGLSLHVQQFILTKTVVQKGRRLKGKPLTEWAAELGGDWDPKRDFPLAMLHAERLTQILADELILEILWEQSVRHPERRELLVRYLERAEPRMHYLKEVIVSSGSRLLRDLADAEVTSAAAE